MYSVQPPGREWRIREPAFTSLSFLAGAVVDALAPFLDRPVALYGHSMGAIVAFEVAHRLRHLGHPGPRLLVVSARQAPHIDRKVQSTAGLSDGEFLELLRKMRGTPSELLDDTETMKILLPTIRADFQAIENYKCEHNHPLDCPIVAIGGLEDGGVELTELDAWSSHSKIDFVRYIVQGNHFFLLTSRDEILDIIVRHLRLHT